MRTKIFNIKKAFPILLSGGFLILLSACGTHNNGYADTDGIYTSEKTTATDDATEVDKTDYYKQYFKSKKGTYDELPDEGAIFTDIEAYSTTDTLDEDGYIVTEKNSDYGTWGSNTDEVTVNIYNYGGYGFNYWHRPYWYGGWGYPYWGINFGWGYPYYYGGFYCSPFYGGYYSAYYGGGYGYYNSVAYNRGRRNTDYINSRDPYRSRRDNYSRSESYRRGDSRETRPATRTRSQNETRRSSNTRAQVDTRPRTRTTTESRPRINTRSTTRPSTRPTTRSSSSNRGGAVRSSSGSSRSSGNRSSGGRRGGGRN
jgi:hypothetical protein